MGGEYQVNTVTNNAQRFPKIAMDANGDSVVTWESLMQDGSGYGVYALVTAPPALHWMPATYS